ncbi:A disintegrin and metalloproteinase with thrombospondin motifs 5 [Branchiostoma belcheri]|nr:A disintegrin and metalloproteinase with thrombospondin motifs 5 [Branchiostoma belcheri]
MATPVSMTTPVSMATLISMATPIMATPVTMTTPVSMATPVSMTTPRYSSRPLHVETMVTADRRMVSFHGRHLTHYVLTLMAMAARIYRHPSLHSDIHLHVVKLVIVNADRDGPQVGGCD